MSGSAVTLDDVSASDWSLMLDRTAAGGPGSGIGRIVQGLADIDQCISIIIGTQPGEDPFRPTFGCDLTQYIDRPIGVALPLLVGAVSAAIEQWEPRVTVISVAASTVGGQPGALNVTVKWQIDLGNVQPPAAVLGAGVQTTVATIG